MGDKVMDGGREGGERALPLESLGFKPVAVADGAELYPGQREDYERGVARRELIAEAHATPLPGPLLEAFAHVPEVIAGLRVRPLVHYDLVILQRLKSPLLEQLRKAVDKGGDKVGGDKVGEDKVGDKGKTEFSEEQGYEMILQFTMPAREAAALAAKGPQAFREAALERIGLKLGPVAVGLLVQAVEREFVRAFSTAIEYGPGEAGGVEGAVTFQQPPAAPRTTGSAGGCAI